MTGLIRWNWCFAMCKNTWYYIRKKSCNFCYLYRNNHKVRIWKYFSISKGAVELKEEAKFVNKGGIFSFKAILWSSSLHCLIFYYNHTQLALICQLIKCLLSTAPKLFLLFANKIVRHAQKWMQLDPCVLDVSAVKCPPLLSISCIKDYRQVASKVSL